MSLILAHLQKHFLHAFEHFVFARFSPTIWKFRTFISLTGIRNDITISCSHVSTADFIVKAKYVIRQLHFSTRITFSNMLGFTYLHERFMKIVKRTEKVIERYTCLVLVYWIQIYFSYIIAALEQFSSAVLTCHGDKRLDIPESYMSGFYCYEYALKTSCFRLCMKLYETNVKVIVATFKGNNTAATF